MGSDSFKFPNPSKTVTSVGKQMTMIEPFNIRLNYQNIVATIDSCFSEIKDKATIKDDVVYKDFTRVWDNIRSAIELLPHLSKDSDLSTLMTNPATLLSIGGIDFSMLTEDIKIFKSFVIHAFEVVKGANRNEAVTSMISLWQHLQSTVVQQDISERLGKKIGREVDSYLDRARKFKAENPHLFDSESNTTSEPLTTHKPPYKKW